MQIVTKVELKYIQTIAQAGSLSRAAATLYVSQPYLSKILREVEDEYKVTLFDRSKRPLQPTPAGEILLRYADELSRLDEKLMADLYELRSDRKHVLRFGINQNRFARIAPKVLPLIKLKYPDFDVIVFERRFADIMTMLDVGDIDIGVVSSANFPAKLTHEVIGQERFLFVLPPKHRLGTPEAKGNLINPSPLPQNIIEEIQDEVFIMVSPELGLGRFLEKNIFFVRKHDKSKFMYTGGMSTAYELSLQGLGCSIVTEPFISVSEDTKEAYFYSIGDPPLEWTQLAVYSKDFIITPEARYFLDIVKQNLN